jgi:cytoskeleton protein RodZ
MKSGKTIDEASRETKIAKKYLIGIENENFDNFPGETYLIGFIRNYAQFLGLDPDEMIRKYRDYKIQEQPAPIEQLTARPKSNRKYYVLALIVVIIISASLYFSLSGRREETDLVKRTQKEEKEVKKSKGDQQTGAEESTIAFEEEEVIKDFKKGDSIEVPVGSRKYLMTIDGIDDKLDFSVESIPFSLETDEHVEIDFDRDGRKDLLISPNRLGEGMVNLTLKRMYKTDLGSQENASSEVDSLQSTRAAATGSTEGPPEVLIIKEEGGSSPIPIAPKSGFQIVSSFERNDIVMSAKGLSTAFVGFTVDDGKKEELLLRNGEVFDVTARDVLRLTVANAKGLEMKLNNVPVTLGESGQVVAKVVRWYRDDANNNLYHLVMDDWEK